MKVVAKYLKQLFNERHHSEVTLLIENHAHQRYLSELEPNKEYAIEIKEVRSKRSLQQNKYLWALIRELSLVTKEDDLDLYIKLLESSNAKFDYVWGLADIEDSLRKSFRAVKRLGKRDIIAESGDLVNGYVYKCYQGSSKFNTKEMNQLIDTLIVWCEAEDINTDERLYNVE